MDQKKIGCLLQQLRKEKGLTQEQLAEVFNVSDRSVSRWENGITMPDLSLLLELADYFDVNVRELLEGERKMKQDNQELDETVRHLADYSNQEKQRLSRIFKRILIVGLFAFSGYIITLIMDVQDSHLFDFCSGVLLGFSYGAMILGVLYNSESFAKIHAVKKSLLKLNK